MISLKNIVQNTALSLFLLALPMAYAIDARVTVQPSDISACAPCAPCPCPDTCCDNSCFSGEVFWFKPSIDQSAFAISSEENIVAGRFYPSGERHVNSPSYKPGFRLEWTSKWCCDPCYSWDVRFAYFNGGHSKHVSGPFLFDTLGFPGNLAQDPLVPVSVTGTSYSGFARLHDNFRYYALDATLNRACSCGCNDSLVFLIGLHYASIKHKRFHDSFGTFTVDTVAIPLDNELSLGSHFWGIGPEVGLDYRYNCTPSCCCSGELFVTGSARAMLLASRSDADFHYNTLRTAGTRGVNLKNGDLWRVTPSFDASLGFSYEFCVCNTNASIDVGYEWLWYNDAVDSITAYDDVYPGDSFDLYSNFSLHGPYVRLNVCY